MRVEACLSCHVKQRRGERGRKRGKIVSEAYRPSYVFSTGARGVTVIFDYGNFQRTALSGE